jgi:hypothetical protein
MRLECWFCKSIFDGRRKDTRYCSKLCKGRASHIDRRRIAQKAKWRHPKPCAQCRAVFTPTHPEHKYCGLSCQQAVQRVRHAAYIKAYQKEYREKNRDTLNAKGREYMSANAARISRRLFWDRRLNPVRYVERRKRYRAKYRERLIAEDRQWYLDHKEQELTRARDYRRRNPDKWKVYKQRWKAKKHGTKPTFDALLQIAFETAEQVSRFEAEETRQSEFERLKAEAKAKRRAMQEFEADS